MTAAPDATARPLDRGPAMPPRQREHRFHVGMALAIAATALVGFAPTYYLKPFIAAPPLSPLVHLHGVLFTLWLALYLTQTSLIATGRTQVHRRLGVGAAVLACLLLAVGYATAIATARRGVSPISELSPTAFLAVPLGALVAFVVLLGLGLHYRRRAPVHKRLMLLATLALLVPAFARIGVQVGVPGPVLPLGGSIAYIAGTWVHDWRAEGRIHPALLYGGIFLAASIPVRFLVDGTAAWQRLAAWLVR